MDSFYDAPRPPPVPTVLNKVMPTDTFPQVSIICQENTAISGRFNNNNQPQTCFKAAKWSYSDCTQFQMPRKQVRFENANTTQQRIITNIQCTDSVQSSDNLNNKTITNCGINIARDKENMPHDAIATNFNLDGKSFKQIYMANIPNRDLDLSILETATVQTQNIPDLGTNQSELTDVPEKPAVAEYKVPRNYKEWKQISDSNKQSDSTLNYKVLREQIRQSGDADSKPNSPCLSQRMSRDSTGTNLRSIENTYDTTRPKTSKEMSLVQWNENNLPAKNNSDGDPALKELLEIVKMQNQQIMLLQQQVTTLTNCIQYPHKQNAENVENIQTEPSPRLPKRNFNASICDQSHRHPFVRNSPKCSAIPKTFAIDVKATCLELSFCPQVNTNNKQNKRNLNQIFEPTLQEITDDTPPTVVNETAGNPNELSLNLQESLVVRDTCPSPPPSFGIDMDAYETSSSDEDTSDSGGTLYQDIMNQVNNALENVQMQNGAPPNHHQSPALKTRLTDQTINEVKNATLRHLQGLGVRLPSGSSCPDSDSRSTEYSPTEVSYTVKHLLLKYLPDDHLAKLGSKQNKKTYEEYNSPAAGTAASEFSFKTLQYMKKYNLLKKGNKVKTCDMTRQKKGNDKILNMSTLKLKPKLI